MNSMIFLSVNTNESDEEISEDEVPNVELNSVFHFYFVMSEQYHPPALTNAKLDREAK